MGGINEHCTKCGHLLASHAPDVGCTHHVPGTIERMPGACGCGAPEVLADVIPFRTRSQRDALARGLPLDEDGGDGKHRG